VSAATDIVRSTDFYLRLGLRQIVAAPHYAHFVCPQGDSTFSIEKADVVRPGWSCTSNAMTWIRLWRRSSNAALPLTANPSTSLGFGVKRDAAIPTTITFACILPARIGCALLGYLIPRNNSKYASICSRRDRLLGFRILHQNGKISAPK
jgi:hypothetical protein